MKHKKAPIAGSGNVFIDLGFSPAEAHSLSLRSDMMTALCDFMEREKLTQAKAAKCLKVSQPRISDLKRGKLSKFSMDALVGMLTDAGLQVDLKIKASSRKAPARKAASRKAA
jgi:predicted XRE-type DNA-binding protein